MKKLLGYLAIILIIIIISCDKDSVEMDNSIIVGVDNPKLMIQDINPDTVLTSWHDTSNYTIDINADGIVDINFSVFNQYMFGGTSLYNSELRLETLNNEIFVLTADSIYLSALTLGDTLTLNGNWTQVNQLLLHSREGCCPPTGTSTHEGYWKGKKENYVGIKFKDQLGWIKIGVENYTTIKIFEYTLLH